MSMKLAFLVKTFQIFSPQDNKNNQNVSKIGIMKPGSGSEFLRFRIQIETGEKHEDSQDRKPCMKAN